ncbi:serine/threonine protein kinase [Myxococcota bacterium]|nr:serine/threonine protein kinase [Myxococcota bacterium]
MGERQRYRIIEKIDAGGMAEIYKAVAITLDGFEKPVAIKRILPSLCNQPKFVNMFLDEARLAMHLNHANIVQVFDVGRAQGTYFIVMELIEGYNLRRVFQRLSEVGQRFPVPIALFVVTEMLKGLAHAHERRDANGNPLGIVHRDVSPPNVLISRAGEVKVTDFGLAKAITQAELTDPGIVKGKFSYLSPEAIDGRAVDHRADLFSAGVVLWELLANRRLFLGKTEMETVDLVQKAEVPSLTLLNPDVPEELERLVLKSLARDPRKRYHSAREMGDSLMAFLFQEGLKVTSYDLTEFLRSIFEAQAVEAEGLNQERISLLISDEILSLSMMRYAGQPLPIEGSTPIRLETLNRLGGGHLSSEDLRGQAARIGDGSAIPRTQGTPLVEMLEGRETMAMPALQPRARSGGPWLWVGIGGLLLLGALAAAGWFLLGPGGGG